MLFIPIPRPGFGLKRGNWAHFYTLLLLLAWGAVVAASFLSSRNATLERVPYNADIKADLVRERDFFHTLPTGFKARRAGVTDPHRRRTAAEGVEGRIFGPQTSGATAPEQWEAAGVERLAATRQAVTAADAEVYGGEFRRSVAVFPLLGGCAACHDDKFGPAYVSLAVALAPQQAAAESHTTFLGLLHLFLFAAGSAGLVLAGRRMAKRINERERARRNLADLNEELERRVMARTEEILQRRQELQAFIDNSEAGVFTKNAAGEFTLINKKFAELLRAAPGTVVGRTDAGFVSQAVSEHIAACTKEALHTGRSVETEFTEELPEGNGGRVFSVLIFPLLGPGREPEGSGGVVMDISARKQMEAGLREAKEAAEADGRAKSDFLAGISHEIRTPLNGVIGMADLLLRTSLSAEQTSMVATIKNGGTGLLNVLNDILDFSKIEAGKIFIESIPLSLSAVVFESAKASAAAAHRKNLDFNVRIAPGTPDHLLGDPLRLRRIIHNLIANAVKFTETGGLSVAALALPDTDGRTAHLHVSVADTGIGIPADKAGGIFNAFEQVDASTTRRYGGTGLGLAIASRLARLMGAELVLDATEEGKGTTFRLDLRLPRLEEETRPDPGLAALRKKKTLIVDGDDTGREILREMFAGWGIPADCLPDAATALELLRRKDPADPPHDLIIVNRRPADQNADELCAALSADPGPSAAPVLQLTPADLPFGDELSECFTARVPKPVSPNALLLAMSAVFLRAGGREHPDGPAAPLDETGAALRILLAEDMEINQLVAARMLRGMGHSVRIAPNGVAAVEACDREDFDLIFMDIQMPELDGLGATAKIRAREARAGNSRHVPIIAMTANALRGDKEKYLAGGMDDYVAKPVDLDDLHAAIVRAVSAFGIEGRGRHS